MMDENTKIKNLLWNGKYVVDCEIPLFYKNEQVGVAILENDFELVEKECYTECYDYNYYFNVPLKNYIEDLWDIKEKLDDLTYNKNKYGVITSQKTKIRKSDVGEKNYHLGRWLVGSKSVLDLYRNFFYPDNGFFEIFGFYPHPKWSKETHEDFLSNWSEWKNGSDNFRANYDYAESVIAPHYRNLITEAAKEQGII